MAIFSGMRLGSYEVIAPLGAGGMGEVWRAKDSRLGREVAIKFLPEEVAAVPSRLRRFEKEARSASALNHPNIVTIYDIGAADSVSWIAMEKIEGKTLRELLLSGRLPVKRVLQLATQIADGLARAHEAGIVHRDLKPENVMVTKDGLVKILDFGLAKRLERSLDATGREQAAATEHPVAGNELTALQTESGTSPGVVLGTVGYMSPEQANGSPVDFRSDQFSFGSVLYEMATGKSAFQKATAVDTLSAILHEEPTPVAQISPEAPAPLRWVVERCLAKDPEDRYGTTKDLARELATLREHLSEATVSGAGLATAARRKGLRLAAPLAASLAVLAVAATIGIAKFRASTHAPSFRRLTFRSGSLGMARFAPDGQTIVYSATWGETRDVFLMRIGNPESRLLYSNTDLYSVSDTGELAIMPGTWLRQPNLLARVPLSGGAPREVVEDVAWANADWAPGGQGLAIIRSVAGKNRLEFPIGKTLYETSTKICCPRFSPDGRTIAFFETNVSVRILQADGQGAAVLSSGWDWIEGVPCWNRGGQEIWFTAGRKAESPALFRVDRSGRLRLIARVPGTLELFDISARGQALLAHYTRANALKWGRTAGGEAERELSWLDWSWLADLSADGRSILFTEIGEGGGAESTMYLRPTDGSDAKRLGEGVAFALSPDGKWVLGTRGGRLALVPTGPGQPRFLAGPPSSVTGGDWIPDGKQIVFSGGEGGKGVRLYVQEVDGGPPRAISPEGVTLPDFGDSVSPDGRLVVGLPVSEQETLYSEQRGEPRLYRTDGGESRSIPALAEGEVPIGWTAGGEALYIYRRGRLPVDVHLLDIVTGQRREWRKTGASGFAERLVISRDGTSYAYNSRTILSELELAEGLK